MTAAEPTGQPDIEHPIDLTDTPDQNHPGRPGDDRSSPNDAPLD